MNLCLPGQDRSPASYPFPLTPSPLRAQPPLPPQHRQPRRLTAPASPASSCSPTGAQAPSFPAAPNPRQAPPRASVGGRADGFVAAGAAQAANSGGDRCGCRDRKGEERRAGAEAARRGGPPPVIGRRVWAAAVASADGRCGRRRLLRRMAGLGVDGGFGRRPLTT
jgi:hypothetical protein